MNTLSKDNSCKNITVRELLLLSFLYFSEYWELKSESFLAEDI